jgi:RNA polymerase sigma-70 factor (ECF subfamily)
MTSLNLNDAPMAHHNSHCIDADRLFESELVALMPHLLGFARKLCKNCDDAEDLVQETAAKAWQSRSSFQPGSILRAWLFTILRNQHYSNCRKTWRQLPWNDAMGATLATPANEQTAAVELSDAVRAIASMPKPQGDALLMVGAGGSTYDDAATICGCTTGTVKSRVSRGRHTLKDMLEGKTEWRIGDYVPVGNAAFDIMHRLDRLATVN